jgi:hypothetical protein
MMRVAMLLLALVGAFIISAEVTPIDEENFMKWLNTNGVDTSTFSIDTFPHGRGIKALKPFPQGSLLFMVPNNLVLHSDRGFDSPIGDLLRSVQDTVGHFYRLAFFILYELLHPHESFWAPFFGIVPTPHEIPMYWRCMCILSVGCVDIIAV